MRVLVTGATGFLGRHVCKALESRGHEVVGFSREFSLANFEGFPDCVVHLAARCGGIGRNIASPWAMLGVNLKLDNEAVANTITKMCKFIGIGSVCMYPATAPLPLREDDIWNGYPEPTNGPYGIAKRVQLELLKAAHAQYGLPYTFLVLANLYGPGDHFDREDAHVIPMLVKKAVDAKEAGQSGFSVWGDGSPTRDFLYVEDAAEAICRAVEAPATNCPVNIGTGCEYSIDSTATFIKLAAGLKYFWYEKGPQGQPRRAMDTTRAAELLGWKATTGIQEGVENTVTWYLTHRESKPMIPANN